MERLDKYLSNAEVLTRSECKIAIKRKQIAVNGVICKDASQKIDAENDVITYNGEVVKFDKFTYIMMNKPSGVVSATDDGKDTTVVDLVPENMQRKGLFPCGRLDKDTVGLVIITNDGVSAHKKLAPKSKTEKVYYFEIADEILGGQVELIEKGVTLKDGYTVSPCKVKMLSKTSGYITLTEGKYHEIKRIFGSLGNKITYLKRVSFGKIVLDENLEEGKARYLTKQEEDFFTK
jgi:16S rRNA pseudouridine516 synthase